MISQSHSSKSDYLKSFLSQSVSYKNRLNHIKSILCASAIGLGLLMTSPDVGFAQSNPLERALNPASSAPAPSATTSAPSANANALPQGNPSQTRSASGSASSSGPGFSLSGTNAQSAEPTAEEKIRMIEDEESRKQERKRSIREQAFEAALNGLLPLEPDEIIEVLKKYDRTREVIETPFYPLPEPTVSILPVSLDPGVSPPVLNLATGHVSTISVLDATGEPWPIEDLSWAGDFQFAEAQAGEHIFRITPLAEFAYGNLSMRLVGLKTPITLTLKTQRDTVQYRVDIRMPNDGPNAQVPIMQPGPGGLQAGDGLMTSILDGSPPADVERLKVTGVDGRTTAFRANGFIFLRTPLTLLSPGWISSARSGDGTSVYVLNDTPIVLMSDRGKMQRAQLEEDVSEDLL